MAKRSISWMALVAKKLDVTEEWVRELINLKQIEATKIGWWYVHPKGLKEFIKSRANK
jgi:hypothetical protein